MKSFLLTIAFSSTVICLKAQTYNYNTYHQKVIRCEQLISKKKISKARQSLDSLFEEFDFVFLREHKLVTELSIFESDYESAFRFLRYGILSGWSIKSIEKNRSLKPLRKDPRWDMMKDDYDSLRKIYWSKLNIPLRNEAQEMLKNDQKLALRNFLTIGEKNKIKYAHKKFIPYSEGVLARLDKILTEHGYPGEKLIGNSWWTSVNLSHHNSLDPEYTLEDTLYLNLRPKLENALVKGELHPKEFAIIEDWRNASIHHHESSLHGFLGKIPNNSELMIVNQNRAKMGIRSIELRNSLLEIEKELGLNLYLPKGWQKGKITVANK